MERLRSQRRGFARPLLWSPLVALVVLVQLLQALRQPADRLPRYGMKGGECKITPLHALIQEGLNVRLRKDAAAAGNLVYRLTAGSEVIKLLNRDLEKLGDLVDERSRSPGATAVHSHIRSAKLSGAGVLVKKNHLRVLTAKLDGDARLREKPPYGKAVGNYLLHMTQSAQVGRAPAAAPDKNGMKSATGHRSGKVAKQLRGYRLLSGTVAKIAMVENCLGPGISNYEFYRRGTDIEAEKEYVFGHQRKPRQKRYRRPAET